MYMKEKRMLNHLSTNACRIYLIPIWSEGGMKIKNCCVSILFEEPGFDPENLKICLPVCKLKKLKYFKITKRF